MIRLTLLLLLLLPFPALAQTAPCAPHESIVTTLTERYGETRRSIALGTGNAVVETFVSEAGTWTITVTAPGGPTCLVAAGQGWVWVAEPDGEPA